VIKLQDEKGNEFPQRFSSQGETRFQPKPYQNHLAIFGRCCEQRGAERAKISGAARICLAVDMCEMMV